MDFVEQVKSAVDIVKVAGEYVRLRRMGATGRYIGLCPFHQEKTPSFNVHQNRQFYKCFGCGAGGDALKFVMEIEGLTFPEALKMLAERNGIPLPQRNEYSDADSRLRGALLEMHVVAAQLYENALRGPEGAEARAYLARRGVSEELIGTFGLGFSDPAGQVLARKLSARGFSPEQMEASGLVRRRNEGTGYYDAFRARMMFPIHNESGKVIAFGGRAVREGDEPKYLNSPETPIYRKTWTLYNLHRAREGMRKASRAVLVEGYMDVIGVWAAGVKEVVATCGTALTNQQVRTIHRHSDAVVLNFDPDAAGANAAERAIQLLLDEGLHVRVLSLGEPGAETKLDPYEFVRQKGADAYRVALDAASGYFHWLADRAREKFDMRSADGRMDAFRFLLPAIQKIPGDLERAAVASDVAGYLGVEPGLVLNQFRKAAATRSAQLKPVQSGAAIPALERILLNTLLNSEQTRLRILPRLPDALEEAFVAHEIFHALRQMGDRRGELLFSELDARLSEQGRTLLHASAPADEIGDDEACLSQAEACLRRLEEDFRRRRLDELRARVKAAEREGDMRQALTWMEELSRAEREGAKIARASGVVD